MTTRKNIFGHAAFAATVSARCIFPNWLALCRVMRGAKNTRVYCFHGAARSSRTNTPRIIECGTIANARARVSLPRLHHASRCVPKRSWKRGIHFRERFFPGQHTARCVLINKQRSIVRAICTFLLCKLYKRASRTPHKNIISAKSALHPACVN